MADDSVQVTAPATILGAVSRTEPSTPLRNVVKVDLLAANYSLPILRDSLYRNHLPRPEIPTLSEILQQERLSRDFSRLRSVSRSRSHSRSRPRTPNRRVSDYHDSARRESEYREAVNSRRRRRSSMITTQSGQIVYDSTYVGPVTIDYLRFLCKVQIDETIARERPPPPETAMKDGFDNSEPHSPASANDFDHSLPLPSDNFLRSPGQLQDVLGQTAFAEAVQLLTEAMEPPPAIAEPPKSRKVFKSYLERILESQRKIRLTDQRTSDSFVKNDTVASHSSEQTKPPINDKPGLVIEDHLVDSAAFDKLNLTSVGFTNTDTFGTKTGLAEQTELQQSYIVDNTDVFNSIDKSPLTKADAAPAVFNGVEYTPNDVYDFGDDAQDMDITPNVNDSPGRIIGNVVPDENPASNETETPGWNPHQYSPSEIVTPPQDPELYHDRINSTSPQGIIHEEYTMNDAGYDDNQQTALLEDPIIDDFDNHIDSPPDDGARKNLVRVTGTSSASKRAGTVSELPLNKIRHLVKHIQHTSSATGLGSPPRKKKRVNRLPPATYSHIQKLSGEFLQSLVGDLEAYATHRGASQILLKDVVLYLNRIRTAEKGSDRFENITNLAQDFFPLEHLISLDNSLQEAMSGKANKETQDEHYDPSESETEFNGNGVKRLQNFSDSDTGMESEY